MRMIDFSDTPLSWLRRPFFLIVGIVLAGLLISLLVFNIIARPASGKANNSHSPTVSTTASLTPTEQGPLSPLIFGSNLPQLDKHHPVSLSASTRTLLQQLPVRMMRIPLSFAASPTALTDAAILTKDIGATPLLVLPGPGNSNTLADDTQIVEHMNTIFGAEPVYYEYEDEADLIGISATSYVLSWNAVIPELKRLAPQDKFLGPATYSYDQAYLRTFLQYAQPLPDEVSWHEYTCNATSSQALCLTNIAQWTAHISNARSMMTTLIGRALPIVISEWNYAANPTPVDGKSNDNSFLTTWTSRAIQVLVANRIFAALQYTCMGSAAALIGNDNQLTAQGQAFQQAYEHFISQGMPASPTPTLSSTPTPPPPLTPTPAPTATPSPDVPTPQPTAAPPSTPTPTPTAPPTSGGAYPELCQPNWNATLRVYSLQDGTWSCFGSSGSGQVYANVAQPGQICDGIYSNAQVEIDNRYYVFPSANACFSAPPGSKLVQWITFP